MIYAVLQIFANLMSYFNLVFFFFHYDASYLSPLGFMVAPSLDRFILLILLINLSPHATI